MNLRKKIGTVMQIGLLIMILFAAGCGLQKQEEGIRTYRFYVKIMNGKKQLCGRFYIAEELETIRQMTVIKNVNGWVMPGVKDHEIKWKDDSMKYAAQRATGINDRPIWLSDTWDITELEVHGAESFDDITELPNLEILSIDGKQVKNLEGIGKLKKLKQLYIRGENCEGLEPIGDLTSLESLLIFGHENADFIFLGNLTNLKELSLYSHQMQDISWIEKNDEASKIGFEIK